LTRMETIKNIWFENERIFMLADDDKVYSRPLEAFPILKEANDAQRLKFKIYLKGKALRWDELDEDIHISSFTETKEPEYPNEIARIFSQIPELNVSAVARTIGINKSLLSSYIYGMKKPSPERTEEIKSAIREIGQNMIAVV